MLCSPDELTEKSRSLLESWQRYRSAPSVEQFVELAVAINGFTEFLIDKGVNALHHASHQLEQLALTLCSEEISHPLGAAAIAELEKHLLGLAGLVRDHVAAVESLVERRQEAQDSVHNVRRIGGIWLVGKTLEPWRDLLAQLKYFGLSAAFLTWNQSLPARAGGDPLLLLDIGSLPEKDWHRRVKALRRQFAIGQLIGLAVRSDFQQLQYALGIGCDACLPEGTPLQTIVAKILELNERHEQEPGRVLIVEDSKTASHVIQRTLEENHMVTQAIKEPRQTLDALREFSPDLILMDMYMPKCTGVEAARVIRQYDEFLSIPIVYLSGESNVALQVDALRLGGDQFLTKPFNPIFFNAIVKSKIERYRALRRSMYHDSLTGLLNHTSGKDRLDTMLAQVEKDNGSLSLAMLDIDHFKKVNDSYGHPVGDQIIRSLSWLLKQKLRRQNILCRYGGEEFLIGMPQTRAEQAITIMDGIRRDFSQICFPHRGTVFSVTASVGVATFPDYRSSDALVKAADDALYGAKREGRNCTRLAKS